MMIHHKHILDATKEILVYKSAFLYAELGQGSYYVPALVALKLKKSLTIIGPAILKRARVDDILDELSLSITYITPHQLRQGIKLNKQSIIYVDDGVTGLQTLQALHNALKNCEYVIIRRSGPWHVVPKL